VREGDLTLAQRLMNRAITVADLPLPESVKADPRTMQNFESDHDFHNLRKFADAQAIPTPVVKEMLTEFVNGLIEGGGKVTGVWLDRMERHFEDKLRGDQRALLRRWLKEEVKAVR
jgi:hypothetical protein